jgi:hypothetical protein
MLESPRAGFEERKGHSRKTIKSNKETGGKNKAKLNQKGIKEGKK